MRPLFSRVLIVLLILLSVLPLAAPASANVDLAYFDLLPASTNTQLLIKWGTETETDTAAFRLKRATVNDVTQAQTIKDEQARGTAISGADYEYTDSNLTPGQVYFYWLVELTTSGGQEVVANDSRAPGSAAATNTPITAAPTATPTTRPASATPTTGAGTPTSPPPTATQPAPTATPVPPTATLPPAATNTPAPGVTPPAATATSQPTATPVATSQPGTTAVVAPTNTVAAAQPITTPDEAATATALAAAQPLQAAQETPLAQPGEALPTPIDNADVPGQTPGVDAPQALAQATDATISAPQAQLLRPTATPRAGNDNSNTRSNSSLLLVIGAGSLIGAALLALVALFVWRRR